MQMYCITIKDDHLGKISKLGYLPVGLGKDIFSKSFIRDNSGENITEKNPYYGEYTFHYWLWRNKLKTLDDGWVGFCQYRKFWSIKNDLPKLESLKDLKDNILNFVPKDLEKFDSILGKPLFINQFKLTKFIKKDIKKILSNPSILFDKRKRNIKFHFDLMHGEGNLDKAISFLEPDDKEDFRNFVNEEVSFNPHNMFICKSKKILNNYYNKLFPWLKKCEKEFGFNLDGYGLKRIYGFLAERYMSFWFRKYTKSTTLPIIFKDISELR